VKDAVAKARPMIAGLGASSVTAPVGGYGPAALDRNTANNATVIQMRIVVEAEDYNEAVHFYRDVLGLPEQAAFEGAAMLGSRFSKRVAPRSRSPVRHRSE
jgi:hypothetical protein